jgi:hypothetical protein
VAGNRDTILLETVRTHRARLLSAFLHGELDERRVVNDNVRRFVVSMVLAAIAAAGCVGAGFVMDFLATQAAQQELQQQQQEELQQQLNPTPTPTTTTGTASDGEQP